MNDSTKRYILIETQEREIITPVFFFSYDEAVKEMRERFAEALGISVDSIDGPDEFNSGDTECFIGVDMAWCTRHGINFDWKIYEFDGSLCERDTWICFYASPITELNNGSRS